MKASVRNGIDNIGSAHGILAGKRLGLVTGPTGVDRNLKSTIDILNENYHLICLFGGEHGIRGDIQAGKKVGLTVDAKTRLPVYSLYGDTRHATAEMLDGIDMVVFDMQDVGARFYTFLYTMTYMMEDCAKYGKPMLVLDRINPIGGTSVEGTLLDERFSSFVGQYAIPTRYALTIGELAAFLNTEKGLGCELSICKCSGWHRNMYYDDTDLCWTPPSPNIPTVETAITYIGTCMFEGTNISEGRGTTKPFELIGAPWIDSEKVIGLMREHTLPGVKFREACFRPTFSKYCGELCRGVEIHITDRDAYEPFRTSMLLLDVIRRNHSEFEFLQTVRDGGKLEIELLLGTDEILSDDFELTAFIKKENLKVEAFALKCQKHHFYDV